MGDLLHIHDPHGRSQRLLPWLVNGTLDATEEAEVHAHLEQCGECRANLARERELRLLVAEMPTPADDGWDRLSAKVARRVPSRERRRARWLGRSVPLPWAIGAQLAVAASIALAFLAIPQGAKDREPGYRLLGSAETRPKGNVIVLFAPETTEQAMRAVLADAGARIADGPTVSGAYVLAVDPSRQEPALAALRRSAGVMLAEPIAADGAR